ncbi:condensation domain-containing protein [Dactylosporangium aurantiacum]|uniref:condensation domain-containing protein n=1 Tax=Dactylosporangium aurantiacum TaxID=35754 RepID=UPI0005250073|nr:condensation domain-containing protein [Dactylosporangium aurantiacum]MDG6107850.1 condensation domain-containing protein [Dactylosporangium aurantiacum]
MDNRTSHVIVAFHGDGGGTEELTWGQRDVWDLMRRTGRTMNIGGTVPAAEGETVERVAAVLRLLMSRHQALRTRLSLVDGEPPRQVVSTGGEIALEVLDAAGDPAEAAEQVRVRYQTTAFDPCTQWPVRMAVVRAGGTPTHIVVMYYHVVVDGFGINAIVRDLANLDPAAGVATVPVQGTGPLELARQQRTPAALRASAQSLRYWHRQLLRIPPADPPSADPRAGGLPSGGGAPGGVPGQPRFWEVVCGSPATALAVRRVSARTRVASGPVLLAAYAVATAHLTGSTTAVVQVIVSNRFRPGFAEAVGSLRQFGLCVIDVTGPFDAVVARAWSAAIGAYKHGYYDPVAHRELTAGRDLSCYLNDRRAEDRDEGAGPVPTEDDVRAARDATTVRWGVREDTYDGALYLHVEDDANYSLWGDTHRFAPEAVERCARDVETVLVEAALDLVTVPAAPR